MPESLLCTMPFNSLELSPEGTAQVCCKIRKIITKPDQNPYNILHDDLVTIWNSEDLNVYGVGQKKMLVCKVYGFNKIGI